MPFKSLLGSSATAQDLEPLGQAATLGSAPISLNENDVTPTNSPPHSPSPTAAPIALDFGVQFRRFMSHLNSQGFTASDRMIPLLEKICQRMETSQTAECKLSLVCNPLDPSFAKAKTLFDNASKCSEHVDFHGLIEFESYPAWETDFRRQQEALRADDPTTSYESQKLLCQLTNETDDLHGATVQELLSQKKAGSFGEGYYFTEDFLKANDYDQARGNPRAVRFAAEFYAILGKMYVLDVGRFDGTLKKAPSGYDSIKGFMKRAYEFVVYKPRQFIVKRIFIYTFKHTAVELATPIDIPECVKGQVFYITSGLSEFMFKLEARAKELSEKIGKEESLNNTKMLIGYLLRGQLHPEDFVLNCEKVLEKLSPPGLLGKLKEQIAISASKQGQTPPEPTVATVQVSLNGKVFLITKVLNEFLTDIRTQAARVGKVLDIQINDFLTKRFVARKFLEEIHTILQKVEPYSEEAINELQIEVLKTRVLR